MAGYSFIDSIPVEFNLIDSIDVVSVDFRFVDSMPGEINPWEVRGVDGEVRWDDESKKTRSTWELRACQLERSFLRLST